MARWRREKMTMLFPMALAGLGNQGGLSWWIFSLISILLHTSFALLINRLARVKNPWLPDDTSEWENA